MKHLIILAALAFVFILFFGNSVAYSQATFKIPFKFEVEDKSFPPGNYRIVQKEEGKITLQGETGGEEVLIPIIEKLTLSTPPITEPQLIFDMVANFEPSYTEYVTEYLLAEVWLTTMEGFLVLDGERSEYNQSVKGVKTKK
jgi:hypothetical protein